MTKNNNEVLEYWNKNEIESMYDKNLLNIEIELIKSFINPNSKILDAGCGEGEGTLEYSKIKNIEIDAVDFSDTRLLKAKNRLKYKNNVKLEKIDFLEPYKLDGGYDFIISQRFLINLMEWELQKKVILDLISMLKPGGKLLMLEGSKEGVNELNHIRKLFNLDPLGIKWHNLFLENNLIDSLIEENNLKLISKKGLGEYFLLTRAIRPYFDKKLEWDDEFNYMASKSELVDVLRLNDKCSRLILWVIEK